MKIRVWYSVSNGGDGSAYPVFFANEAEAKEHQEKENEFEGWAEDCYGSMDITVDSERYFIEQNSIGCMNEDPWSDIYPEGKDEDSVAYLEVIDE